jgi:hypothetical protein
VGVADAQPEEPRREYSRVHAGEDGEALQRLCGTATFLEPLGEALVPRQQFLDQSHRFLHLAHRVLRGMY